MGELGWHRRDEQNTTRHALVVAHVGFRRKFIARQIRHNFRLLINFGHLLLAAPPAKIVHLKPSGQVRYDATSSSLPGWADVAHPSQVEAPVRFHSIEEPSLNRVVQITGQAGCTNALYQVRNCLAVRRRDPHDVVYTHIRPKQVQIKFDDLARLNQVSLGDAALN